jgi:PAS domain S-box-containing protein
MSDGTGEATAEPASASAQLALLRSLVDALPAMLAYWDRSLTCRFANAAYEKWFGVEPEKMIGRDMAEFLGPLFALNRPFIEGALRGEAQCFEREIPDPRGGPPRHSEALYMPHIDPVDATVHGFCVLVTDVTSRKLRELELRAAKEESARQRDVLEHFFTLSLDLMCIVGPDGYFRRVSPGFDALGYSGPSLLARPFVDGIHPDDVAATRAVLATQAAGARVARFENRYRCRDASYRWLAWSCAADEEGTLYLIARDVTEAKQANEALARARDAAEAANRELEAFSYSVAHDLRAPLRSIDGFSQALLEDCGDRLDATEQGYLGKVRASARHMAQLIDDLLGLSQVSRATPRREVVDLGALARTVIARLRVDTDRQVDVSIQDELRCEGDPGLLTLVLENLLGNAWKFTARRAEPRIELGAQTEAGRQIYFVRDNGAGFDMAYASKLFGVFQRLHTAREFHGTGIGLATVRRVIDHHGGRIWAEAAPDRGATFFFTLGARG